MRFGLGELGEVFAAEDDHLDCVSLLNPLRCECYRYIAQSKVRGRGTVMQLVLVECEIVEAQGAPSRLGRLVTEPQNDETPELQHREQPPLVLIDMHCTDDAQQQQWRMQ